MAIRDELSYQTIERTAMPAAMQKSYDAFRKAKDAFEAASVKALKKSTPEGHVVVHSYRGGRYAVGFAPADRLQKRDANGQPKGANLFG